MAKKGGILSWLKFETKEERRKRMEAYHRRMFPFGDKQLNWEKGILKQLFPKSKDIDQMHYELLVLRENLYNTQLASDDDDYLTWDQAISSWEGSATNKFLKPEMKKAVMSIAILENSSSTFETLPTVEDIQNHMSRM